MKNMKKILMSLLMMAPIVLTGCELTIGNKDDDKTQESGSGNESNGSQSGEESGSGSGSGGSGSQPGGEGSGSGSEGSGSQPGGEGSGSGSEGSGSQPGGSQTPEELTQAEQEAAFTTLKNLSSLIVDKEVKIFTIEELSEEEISATVVEEGLTQQEIEEYNNMLAELAGTEKNKTVISYDLNNSEGYKLQYSYDEEEEEYVIDDASYYVKSGNDYIYYSNWEDSSYGYEAEYVSPSYMEKELITDSIFAYLASSSDIDAFKRKLCEDEDLELEVACDDIEITISEEEGVYALKLIMTINEDGASAVSNVEIKFTNDAVLYSTTATVSSYVSQMPFESTPVDINISATMTYLETYSHNYNPDVIDNVDFTEFGEPENLNVNFEIFINGYYSNYYVDAQYKDSMTVLKDSLDQKMLDLGISGKITGYYLDEQMTQSYLTLGTVPGDDRSIPIYIEINEDELEEGEVAVIFNHEMEGYSLNATFALITLENLTDNVLEIEEYLDYWYADNLYEVLVDGETVTGDIVLGDKPVVVVTFRYSEA